MKPYENTDGVNWPYDNNFLNLLEQRMTWYRVLHEGIFSPLPISEYFSSHIKDLLRIDITSYDESRVVRYIELFLNSKHLILSGGSDNLAVAQDIFTPRILVP